MSVPSPASFEGSSLNDGGISAINDDDELTSHSQIDISKLLDINTKFTGEVASPKPPSKCPLFCVFYAVFDLKIGPTVKYSCPPNFMQLPIDVSTNQIHEFINQTFEEIKVRNIAEQQQQQQQQPQQDIHQDEADEQQENFTEDLIEKNDTNQQPGTTSVGNSAGASSKETIFDSTSEYIITGSQLTGKIITLSTHACHVMSRPTQIVNEKYERNSLLFSIGFVLRRAADPRPFRPLISKLALTLRSMEVESSLLSNPSASARTIQPLLERILLSLNSPSFECNLVLDPSTALNLKLFHPPKPQTAKVEEHSVPVLLRRDRQLQLFEWDLAINWVILHIDGITTARQISIKAEVDLEMVLACLRVLKHHNVIAVVDMFMYSNRYEFTERAASMLAGQENKLLQEAIEYCIKKPTIHVLSSPAVHKRIIETKNGPMVGVSDMGNSGSPKSPSQGSPLLFHQHAAAMIASSGNVSPSSSYPPRGLTVIGSAGGSHRSSNLRYAMMAANSLDRDHGSTTNVPTISSTGQSKEGRQLKTALAELYCSCSRTMSFGDLWLTLTMELPKTLVVPSQHQQQQQRTGLVTSSSRGVVIGGGGNMYQRNAGSRKNSLTDYDLVENETVSFSPLEANLLDALRRGSTSLSGTDDKDSINHRARRNWNQIFSKFDHRRFFTFGVVHGLVVRVHSYPVFAGPFPARRKLEQTRAFDHSSSSSLIAKQNSYSLNSAAAMASYSESIRKQKKKMKEEALENDRFKLAQTVASMMDGTVCDDRLVSIFERPYKQLVELVEKYAEGKKVIHIYATATDIK